MYGSHVCTADAPCITVLLECRFNVYKPQVVRVPHTSTRMKVCNRASGTDTCTIYGRSFTGDRGFYLIPVRAETAPLAVSLRGRYSSCHKLLAVLKVVLHWTDDIADPQYAVSSDALRRLEGFQDARGRPLKVRKLYNRRIWRSRIVSRGFEPKKVYFALFFVC